MDGWMEKRKREITEMLWSDTRCLAGIRSGPHEASLTHSTKRFYTAVESTPAELGCIIRC